MSRLSSAPCRCSVVLALRFAVLVAVAAAGLGLSAAHAQSQPEIEWTQTGLVGPVKRLYAPSSGALLARTADGLARSDDGGLSWAPVSLPAAPPMPGMPPGWTRAIAVDPMNHAVIYVATAEGIYKTDDDAASWRLVLPVDPEVPGFLIMAISPADPLLVYVALRHQRQNRLRLVRSGDGGQSWETIANRELHPQVSCEWGVPLLQAHATDPNSVFLAASCSRNAQQASLELSTDRGATWTEIYTPKLAEPDWLLTPANAPAGTILMTLHKDSRGGGSALLHSPDNGASWATLLEFSGGGGMSGGGPNVTMGGLAADPTAPDRWLLGLNVRQGANDLDSQLRLSTDAGSSWTDVAPPGFPRIHDLAFGVDGRAIFAATETGVWRTPAGSGQ